MSNFQRWTEWQLNGVLSQSKLNEIKDTDNIGLVASYNNLFTIDFDGIAGYEPFKQQFPELIKTTTILTGSGKGYHVYFQTDTPPESIKSKGPKLDGIICNIELMGTGRQQVVLPPSVHPVTHKKYELANNLEILWLEDR